MGSMDDKTGGETAAKLDPELCRQFADQMRAHGFFGVATQLIAAVDLAEQFATVDALCAKMAAEHRLDLQRIMQLADLLRSAGIALPEGIPERAPALTADEVRAMVREAINHEEVLACHPAIAEFVALREALHRRLQEVGDLRPVVVAAEAWRDSGGKGLGSHAEQDLQAAVDYLRSKPSGSRAAADRTQREADLRDAYLAGVERGDGWDNQEHRESVLGPDTDAAAEYARSKSDGAR